MPTKCTNTECQGYEENDNNNCWLMKYPQYLCDDFTTLTRGYEDKKEESEEKEDERDF